MGSTMHSGTSASSPISRVVRGSVAAFVIYGAGIGLTYCSQLVIARFVGVDAYGAYAYVFAWMTVLAYFSALGFDVALLRFLPAYEAERKWSLFRGVIQYAERRAAIVGVSCILIGICFIMYRGLSPQLRNTFLIGLMLVPVWALLWVRCSVVRAFGGVVLAIAPDRVVRDGVLVGLVAFASLGLGWSLDATMVITATLMSSALALCVASVALRRLHPHAIDNILPTYDAPAWRRAAVPLVIIGATETLMNRTGVIMLGWIGDTKAAGIYSLAFNIAFVVALPRMAINTLFAPTVSSLFSRNDQLLLRALITSAASWALAGSTCIAFALFVFAEPFLTWFGPGYDVGVPALRILLLGQVIVAGTGSQLFVMTMTGFERGAAALLVSSAMFNAAVSAALIGPFGLTGAAIASAATLIILNLAMALFLWRHLSLLPGVFASRPTPFPEKATC
jgi:O-antigen/teichoic acid export membrane protein